MHMTFTNCMRVVASNLRVIAPAVSPNTDGIHISASKGVEVKDTIIRTGQLSKGTIANFKLIQYLWSRKYNLFFTFELLQKRLLVVTSSDSIAKLRANWKFVFNIVLDLMFSFRFKQSRFLIIIVQSKVWWKNSVSFWYRILIHSIQETTVFLSSAILHESGSEILLVAPVMA